MGAAAAAEDERALRELAARVAICSSSVSSSIVAASGQGSAVRSASAIASPPCPTRAGRGRVLRRTPAARVALVVRPDRDRGQRPAVGAACAEGAHGSRLRATSSSRSPAAPNRSAQLAGRRDAVARLAEAVDPDAAQTELVARRDVVKERRGDVTWPSRGARACGRRTPPSGGARACTSRSPVRRSTSSNVTPSCTCDAAMKSRRCSRGRRASSRARRSSSSARAPRGTPRQPGSESASAVLRALGRAEPAHRLGHHVAVTRVAVGRELGLDLVVALEQLVGAIVAEDPPSSARMPPFQSISVP